MSVIQVAVVVATLLFIIGLVLLLTRIAVDRSTRTAKAPPTIPTQRSAVTAAEMVRLNQDFGAGRIGETEYQRRRKELLATE